MLYAFPSNAALNKLILKKSTLAGQRARLRLKAALLLSRFTAAHTNVLVSGLKTGARGISVQIKQRCCYITGEDVFLDVSPN